MKKKNKWQKCWEEVDYFSQLNNRISKLAGCVQPKEYRSGLAEGYAHAAFIIARFGNLSIFGKKHHENPNKI